MALNWFKDKSDDWSKIASFDDDLASRTDWERIKRRGSNIKTYYAVVVNTSLLRFKKSFFMLIFPWLLMIGGLVLFFFLNGKSFDVSHYSFDNDDQIMKIVVPGILFLAGLIRLLLFSKYIQFDKQTGYYSKGFRKRKDKYPQEGKNRVHLDRIYAIQIVSKIVRNSKRRFRSYELNLVLKDNSRVNVIDHSNQTSIRNDAELLSRFLKVPVWDITV